MHIHPHLTFKVFFSFLLINFNMREPLVKFFYSTYAVEKKKSECLRCMQILIKINLVIMFLGISLKLLHEPNHKENSTKFIFSHFFADKSRTDLSFSARELDRGDWSFQSLSYGREQLPRCFPRRLPRLASPKNIYIHVCSSLLFFFVRLTRPAILPTIARVTYVYPENILSVEALRRAGAVHVRRRTQPLSTISRTISTSPRDLADPSQPAVTPSCTRCYPLLPITSNGHRQLRSRSVISLRRLGCVPRFKTRFYSQKRNLFTWRSVGFSQFLQTERGKPNRFWQCLNFNVERSKESICVTLKHYFYLYCIQ